MRLWRRFSGWGIWGDIGGIRHSVWHVLAAAVIVFFVIPVAVLGAAAAVFYFAPLPAVVPDPQPGALAQTSRVYAADGSLIATFHSEHNRELAPLSQIPRPLQQAVIAAEDSRFYSHSGLDAQAVMRALVADVKAGATVQGGSTITQQYVKNAYLKTRERTIFRKLREALVAGQLERLYTKKKILGDYLNTVYMGKGAYGVQAAAKTFFGKPVSELTVG
ncbi:MAG: transglycosylase domain-containing protein, partial [Actinomycetota bacterium]